MGTSRLDLDVSMPAARQAVRRAAEGWGAELEGDEGRWTLHLPVIAGLRRGVVSGQLEVAGDGKKASVSFAPGESHYSLHWASVVVLLISAAGALLAVLWPLRPDLLRIAPFGALLALGGWFMVLNRLRNSGLEEFLKAVELETRAE